VETCYRHPNRETGVACSNCERPICPECMTSTPVGMRCPECASQRTKVRSGPAAIASTDAPIATYVLIALNVIGFLIEIGAGSGGLGTGGNSVINDGGINGPAIADGDYWRILTGGFLHAGIIHIALNMYVLYVAGTMLEPGIGRARFVGLYFAALFAGSFGALLLDPHAVTVGASGAIFGLMAAVVVIARGRGMDELASQFGIFVVLNLVITFSASSTISVGGHLGGLAAGAVAAAMIVYLERRGRQRLPLEIAALAVLSVVAVGGAIVAANAA
jgi:membrane associated rhomboid family serine protease